MSRGHRPPHLFVELGAAELAHLLDLHPLPETMRSAVLSGTACFTLGERCPSQFTSYCLAGTLDVHRVIHSDDQAEGKK